ncbi:LacI family DNA-binding transcriptional regulator [Pengzhenrongella sicca]|uniref:LacI family DNA-binding transcriptional regulator n=1 Tax=Pengzhenrongella sicca TaxID=2819238 RepID=A0A8A4ZKA6_9MICO|nr:LacI family DNA-binding transcriptional regulator [Pengzhenrongella sicca]QTE30967.1 LacI family DNA-binding transcriptional regulator [Pengzhenrongella sicca]
MKTPTARPTLVDLARVAGVSRATAARVMAGGTSVRPDLALRVHQAAESLGYRTNVAARALRRGKAGAVALVAPGGDMEGLVGPFIGAPIQSASAALLAHGLQPVLLLEDGLNTETLVRHLSSGHVDAAIVILQREALLMFRHLDEVPVPVVFVGKASGDLDPASIYVDCDHYGGARLAARALLTAGRRHISTIAGPAYYLPATQRLQGFLDEFEEWGVRPGPVAAGDFSLGSGSAAMAQLLRRAPDIDGLFAASDLMAVGALRVLEAAGRRAPNDISVVGFDDTVVAQTSNPPLTSVHQPFREMGAAAAGLALTMLDGGTVTESVLLPTTLTVRESV